MPKQKSPVLLITLGVALLGGIVLYNARDLFANRERFEEPQPIVAEQGDVDPEMSDFLEEDMEQSLTASIAAAGDGMPTRAPFEGMSGDGVSGSTGVRRVAQMAPEMGPGQDRPSFLVRRWEQQRPAPNDSSIGSMWWEDDALLRPEED